MNDPCEHAVRDALAAVTPQLTPLGNSRWQFPLLNGSSHIVTVGADGDWLLLETDCAGFSNKLSSFWGAAIQNATFAGLTKLVLWSDRDLRMAAELPVFEGVDLTARLRETCDGFDAQWNAAKRPSAKDVSGAAERGSVDLKALCSDAGWPFADRGGRKLAIELEVQHGVYQALLTPAGQGVRVSCEVATLDSISEECRQAIGGFLLSLSGRVRMGRASVNASGTLSAVQFEVVFETAPGPLEISSALESLSVACSLCGEDEIKALQMPEIAESYLALRGWGPLAARRKERTETV